MWKGFAWKCRKRLKGHSEYSIAISCGVAAYDGQETLEEFLERVDMKMYEDKVQKKQ